jgi:hypothetical protein
MFPFLYIGITFAIFNLGKCLNLMMHRKYEQVDF